MHVAAAILLEVQNKGLHALCKELLHAFHKLVVRGGSEVADADIAHLRTNHVSGVDAMDGNLVANDGEAQRVADAATHDAQSYLAALGTAQAPHDLLARHLDTGNGGVVDIDDAVAGHDAGTLGGSVADGLDDEQRVFSHVELHADALEGTLQGFVHLLHLLGGGVGGVRVELFEHATDAVLDELLLIDAIDIEIGDGQFCHL